MTTDTLLSTLGLPANTALPQLENHFVEALRALEQAVLNPAELNIVSAEEKQMRALYAQYFTYALQWITTNRHKGQKDLPEAAALKARARGMIQDLQNNIVEISVCGLTISRYSNLIWADLRRYEIGDNAPGNIKWTSDIGTLMARSKLQRRQLIKDMQRLIVARPILEQVEDYELQVRSLMADLMGADNTEAPMRSLMSGLRMGDFTKARDMIKKLDQLKTKFGLDQKNASTLRQKITEAGTVLINLVEKEAKIIEGTDRKLLLKPTEIDLFDATQKPELAKLRAFMEKHQMPYMRYNLDSLTMLKDKLGLVGSLSSLLSLYQRLVTGITNPMPEMRDIRMYESEVLERISYMQATQFVEVPKLKIWAQEIIENYLNNKKEYEELETLEANNGA